LNIGVVVFVTIGGFIKADPKNWAIEKEELPKDAELVFLSLLLFLLLFLLFMFLLL
jgi:hypothetical protein